MRTKIIKTKIIAMALAATTVFGAATPAMGTVSKAAETSEQDKEAARQELINKRLNRLWGLQGCDKQINIKNVGMYIAKKVKFYGKRVRAVDNNGNYVYGDWELIDETTLDGFAYESTKFKISGTYVQFAFSFDILCGTDFPYSGVFWNAIDEVGLNEITIRLDGTCRMADITIDVENRWTKIGKKRIVDISNCSSHKEWKP